MSNQVFGTPVSLTADMAAYDRLPAEIADVLKYTTSEWGAQAIEKWWLKYVDTVSPSLAAESLQRQIGNEEPEDTYRAYGPDHPQSDNHGRRLRPASFACWSPKGRKRT